MNQNILAYLGSGYITNNYYRLGLFRLSNSKFELFNGVRNNKMPTIINFYVIIDT